MNQGPPDLTRLSLELTARMIFLGKITTWNDPAIVALNPDTGKLVWKTPREGRIVVRTLNLDGDEPAPVGRARQLDDPPRLGRDEVIVINISGRGDKDLAAIADRLAAIEEAAR